MAGLSHPADVEGLAERGVSDAVLRPGDVPYEAGPITGLVARIDDLGWVGWVACAAACVVVVGWAHVVLWVSGRLQTGAFNLTVVTLVAYGPYALAALSIARRIAARSLVSFWPATGWPVEDRPTWAFRFARAPARLEWVAAAAGAIGGLAALLAAPSSIVGDEPGRIASDLAYAPAYLLGYGLSAAAIAVTARWLWLVNRIHHEAKAIDPFDRAPIYAFSRLTVTVGLANVAATYYSYTVNAGNQAGNVPSLAFGIGTIAVGVLAFVAPLWGIHNRLVDEKDRLTLDVERRINRVATEMYARIDAGSFDETKTVGDSIAGLNVLRDRISHLPTWPWPPQLLRGFVSALLLPIIVYIVSRAISAAASL